MGVPHALSTDREEGGFYKQILKRLSAEPVNAEELELNLSTLLFLHISS